MQVFTQTQGILLLATYFVFVLLLTRFTSSGKARTKEFFLVANREIGAWPGATSIAATWIWAPALFIAAQKAFTEGVAGLFWFTVPNVLCLIIFSYFAIKIRELVPNGYTLSNYMAERFSKRVRNLYVLELGGLAVCSFAVQLLAGAGVLSLLTGIPFLWITLIMAGIAISYSLWSGLKASVMTDYAQMVLILLVGFTLAPWAVSKAGGFQTVVAGLGGITGTYTSIFSGDGATVFYSFGIATTIGLIAGPFGDQSFWQRSFALKKDAIKKAFIFGALLFGLVPLTMSTLGFAAAGIGMEVVNPQWVNLEIVVAFLPTWAVVAFTYMIMCGLISTLDSNLCAISSIVGHDFSCKEKATVRGRVSMIVLAVVALIIANLPGMQILYLFLFYGILRASTLAPTVISLLRQKTISEAGVFWGIAAALFVGVPVFGYGNFNGLVNWSIAGSLLVIILSGGITMLMTKLQK